MEKKEMTVEVPLPLLLIAILCLAVWSATSIIVADIGANNLVRGIQAQLDAQKEQLQRLFPPHREEL